MFGKSKNKRWAVGISYRGFDPHFEQSLAAIAAQHGGKLALTCPGDTTRGLDFHFTDRFGAALARYAMISSGSGVIEATLEARN